MKNTFIRQATINEKGLFKKLIYQYLKELHPRSSTHNYPYLDLYWKEESRTPYLIYTHDDLAGFILVNEYFVHTEIISDKSVAEFYILPSFRNKGIGKAAMFQIWDKYPVGWEVKVDTHNVGANIFWTNTISSFTNENYQKTKIGATFIYNFSTVI